MEQLVPVVMILRGELGQSLLLSLLPPLLHELHQYGEEVIKVLHSLSRDLLEVVALPQA